MNTYHCTFAKRKRSLTVQAETEWHARAEAIAHYKPKKKDEKLITVQLQTIGDIVAFDMDQLLGE